LAENFYTMLTIIGKKKISNSAVSGSKVNFKTLKVGDGKGAYYEPSENQTSLVNEVWSGNVSSISVDEANSNWIIVETVIPATDGSFFIREAGIFDEDGDMIAVSKLAETYKPVVSEGSTKDLVIKIVLEVSNVDSVSLKIDPNVVVATKNDIENLDMKITENTMQLSDIKNDIKNTIMTTPTISYGMNSVIKNTGKTSISPKFTIQGKDYTNKLGKDGNCEDVSKWNDNASTHSLDSSNKVFGNSGIKITLTSTSGTINKVISTWNIDASKYYLVSAYIKNGNCTGGITIYKDSSSGGNVVGINPSITDTTKFTRVGFVLQPSNINIGNFLNTTLTGTAGQYAYVDGIMINEITATEYALGASALLANYPYIDSYSCLQNPYIEVRHDNLVRNGNGEEGIAWWSEANQGGSLSAENGYIKLSFDGVYRYFFVDKNTMPVKPSTTYSYRIVAKAGTHPNGIRVYSNQFASDNSSSGSAPYDCTVTSTTDQVLTGTFTTSSNTTKIYVGFTDGVGGVGTGTNYVKEIMVVEGTVAPTQYLPCRIERCVIEGKFTSDDSFVYENGEVAGLLNWKHKTLFGKDYDWQFNTDYTGYKIVRISNAVYNVSTIDKSEIVSKYDGKLLVDYADGVTLIADSGNLDTTGNIWVGVADTDTGWADTVNPNADEVKAFMNGWVATLNTNGRYIFWKSVIDGSYPSLAVTTTNTAIANAGSNIVVAVTDASKFSVGDMVGAFGYMLTTITAISGNNITVGGISTQIPVGTTIFKSDNGTTNVSLLTYCKNNIAPNYDGYQLHYKLANPEPITDDNCHVHGDIPILDVGDNYLYLDSGIVLGEVNAPVLAADSAYYRINNNWSNNGSSWFRNKAESILSVYKNLIYDTKWIITSNNDGGHTNGFGLAITLVANVDTNATYTVDYKILATQAPQVGTIGCSYSQDIVSAVSKLNEEMNNKQEHDSILESIIDSSIYEIISIPNANYQAFYNFQGVLYIRINYTMQPKKVIPTITLSNPYIAVGGGSSGPTEVSSKFSVASITVYKNVLSVLISTSDAATISSIKSYGIHASYTVTADCRGRI